MFFSSWSGLVRTVVVGLLAYLFLVLWLRLSGKRTLSKWNAFDTIVTIALGSTLATVLLSQETALAEGVLALALLIVLQFVITWFAVRSSAVRRLIKSAPTLLLRQGQFIPQALQSQRVTESEIRAAVRMAGIAALEEVYAVVLEADGSFSVIKSATGGSTSALADVSETENNVKQFLKAKE